MSSLMHSQPTVLTTKAIVCGVLVLFVFSIAINKTKGQPKNVKESIGNLYASSTSFHAKINPDYFSGIMLSPVVTTDRSRVFS